MQSQWPTPLHFADVSGFTLPAERPARREPDGARELLGLVNDYFRQLIPLIDVHAGE
jgi:hypothetical protein